ncbi:L-threonate dehydrogenase [Sulfitobacter sp. LCG007]
MAKMAVIGLGSMGSGMAANALKAGHQVLGCDLDAAKVEQFRAKGGTQGALADIAGDLDAVLLVVLNAAQTEAVLFGPDGIVAKLRAGAVVISCATVSPDFARYMEGRCREAGVLYLDAPISGGAVGAASGTLTVMASGSPEAFGAARPVLDAISGRVFELGDAAGPGSAMKATNQLLAGVHLATMAEALTFGLSQGISPETFLEVISTSAGTSWMLENRTPHIIAGDYRPFSMVDIWPKDLGIVLDIARESRFSAPIAAAALQQFVAAAGMGLGKEDDAAVAKVYARNAGLSLPGETGGKG